MPFFLAHSTYTPEAWSQLIESPEDREAVLAEAAQDAGCKMHGFWFALDAPRGYALFEGDNISMAALLAAADASGSLRHIEATALLTSAEMSRALRKAQGVKFRAPGQEKR
jgi:uncharacterized protein with GYD domain